MTNVLQFPHAGRPIDPVLQFIRLGEIAYQKIGGLFAEGRLPTKRVVIDASKIRHQKDAIKAFKDAHVEIVLDTKAAELSALGRHSGYAKGAPWGAINGDKPIGPEFYVAGRADDFFGQVARCAVEYEVDVVLAPGHFLGDNLYDGWFEIDRRACIELRMALDREGGENIAIDYLLIVPRLYLNDSERRSAYMSGLSDLPFDHLWIRTSDFGNDASHLMVSQYATSLASLHDLGKPIISDYLGGMVGEAVVALGAVYGVAHGVAERERFSAYGWEKPPKKPTNDRDHGVTKRISLSAINKSLTIPEFEVLCRAMGGKGLLVRSYQNICPGGMEDMIADHRRLAAYDAIRHIEDISQVPKQRRGRHFLDYRLAQAVRNARNVKNLEPIEEDAIRRKVDLEKLMKRMSDHSAKLEKLHTSLEHLHESLVDSTGRALPVRPTPFSTPPNAGRLL